MDIGGSEMGLKEMGLLFIFFSCHLAASSPLHNTLPSVALQKLKLMDKESISGTGVVPKYSYSRGTSVNGGRPSGNGGNGNNGQSTDPTTMGGGAATIPIYGAGAANNRHQNNHHSESSPSQSFSQFPTLGAAILATLALHIQI